MSTDVPGDYEVWWKVRNRGDVVKRAGQLRGQIVRQGNDGRKQQTEPTPYPGRHYVEAYVAQNGVVVASDHHEVHII